MGLDYVPEPNILLEFLEQEAVNFGTLSEVRHTYRKLGPFILMGQTGRYELTKNSRRLREEAQRVITKVTREKVNRIQTISISQACKQPKVTIIEPDCVADMRCAVHYNRADRMQLIFDQHIWEPLSPAIWGGIGKWIWNKVGINAWNKASRLNHLVLLLYVGFSLAGASGKMRMLGDWVNLLPRAFPIGPLRDESDCWLVALR